MTAVAQSSYVLPKPRSKFLFWLMLPVLIPFWALYLTFQFVGAGIVLLWVLIATRRTKS